jgi:cell division protein FtsB
MENLKKIFSGIEGVINFHFSRFKAEKEKNRRLRQKIKNLKQEIKELKEDKKFLSSKTR